MVIKVLEPFLILLALLLWPTLLLLLITYLSFSFGSLSNLILRVKVNGIEKHFTIIAKGYFCNAL